VTIKTGAAGGRNALSSALLYKSIPGSLQAPTLNDTNQNHHDRDDQEDMNESAHGVRTDKTNKPEDNQDDSNSLEHFSSPFA
jgi:hypothetical protein